MADMSLRDICNYFLNCISIESSSSVSQNLKRRNSLLYAPINDLLINPETDQDAITLLNKINSNRDAKAFLGYPVRIYRAIDDGKQVYKIAPVFLYPVDYSGGKISINWVPTVNIEVLKGFTDNTADSLSDELAKLESELGIIEHDIETEARELVSRLFHIRQWDWAETIDPYHIPNAESMVSFKEGIYNRPIIIQADASRFTHGLETELMALARIPEDNLKGTALYTWLKGRNPISASKETKPILEVLPLNKEQSASVETALASDLTIVTGPPGTGKSQVVTDLLVNIAWNGKSALFSSKNNKAVDVVDYRANALSEIPFLLRMGTAYITSHLIETITRIISVNADSANKEEVESYINEYYRLIKERETLTQRKTEIIKTRNKTDNLEQEYCRVRSLLDNDFDSINANEKGKVYSSALAFKYAYLKTKKQNNSLFAKLFWKKVEPKRQKEYREHTQEYNKYARKFLISAAKDDMTVDEVNAMCRDAEAFEKVYATGVAYKNALTKLESLDSLETIDKQLWLNKKALSDAAFRLWDKWLTLKAATIPSSVRAQMSSFVAIMKLAGGVAPLPPHLSKRCWDMMRIMMPYLPCWAITSLSVKGKIPFAAGLLDYVIIDEASQCDIASIIPLLYRAKKAIIIGDPKQLGHITQLSKKQDLSLLERYHISPEWSYSVNSVYALAAGKVNAEEIIQLKDHFRSCEEIIAFSNEAFYDKSLRTATDYERLLTPPGEKPGIRWIDVKGTTIRPTSGSAYNMAEAKEIVSEIQRLISSGYAGSIGVVTPFRLQAKMIRDILENETPELLSRLQEHAFIADTVHKFQGDERDVMVFSPVVSDGAHQATLGFLCNTGNLFNVAITRARAKLIVVGNHNYCKNCSVDYLRKFADYYDRTEKREEDRPAQTYPVSGKEYPWVANYEQVSEWEKTFYSALYEAGIETIPQYHADKYYLDLAIILANGNKLDIEVDGEMYHRSWNGELAYRDQLRNQRLFELGWEIKRFWVYQIRDKMTDCINQIQDWISRSQ